MNPGVQEEDLKRVIFEQNIDGVPVYNSRVAFFYLPDGTLFQVQANVIPGGSSVPTEPDISIAEAAKIMFDASIVTRYNKANIDTIPVKFQPPALESLGKFFVYLSESGTVSRVFRFVVTLEGIPGTVAGEYEIFVDTSARQVVIDRRLSLSF